MRIKSTERIAGPRGEEMEVEYDHFTKKKSPLIMLDSTDSGGKR
jgi:hypothetical protein